MKIPYNKRVNRTFWLPFRFGWLRHFTQNSTPAKMPVTSGVSWEKKMKLFAILTLIFISECAAACRPSAYDLSSEIKLADAVSIGVVTGVFINNAEKIFQTNEQREEIILDADDTLIPLQETIRVINQKNIKGNNDDVLEINIGCSLSVELMKSVVVIKKDGIVYAREINDTNLEVISKLKNESN